MLKLLLFSCLSFFLPDITSLPITTLTTTPTTTPTTTLTTTLATTLAPTTTTMYTTTLTTPIYTTITYSPIIEDTPITSTTTTTSVVTNYINITNYAIMFTLVFFGCFLIGLQLKYRVYFNQMLSPSTSPSPQPPPYYEDPSSISSPLVKENSRAFMIKKTMPPPQYSDSDDIELHP